MSESKVAIIDFGAGNLCSIYNAIANIVGKKSVEIVSKAQDLSGYSHIIMPGVGAFDKAMENLLAKEGLVVELEKAVLQNKKPFLGICIGMQILVEEGSENKKSRGLGWLKGKVQKFSYDSAKGLKVPHMCWNNLSVKSASCFADCLDQQDVYFVHSYYVAEADPQELIAECDYIINFPAIIGKGNIVACQFHPEKSGEVGQLFLQRFLQS